MKRFCMCLFMLFAAVSGFYCQTIKNSDFIFSVKRDSLLFHELQLDKDVCPMLDFEKALVCFQFLKRMRVWERHGTPYPRGWSSKDEEYESLVNFGSPWMYEYAEGCTSWKTFAPEFQKVYDAKHGQGYNEEEEKHGLVERLGDFYTLSTYKPLFFKTIEEIYNGSIEAYVNDLYNKSMMTNRKSLKKFLRTPSIGKLDKDLGAQMTIAIKLYQVWLKNYARITPDKMALFVYK